jgi:COMPASS component SPP1
LDARKQLQELDKKQEALDELIEKSKKVLPFTEDEMEDYEDQMNQEGDADLSTYCVTCGHEISNKIAVRHMERCFSKYEAQSSLGSIFKTKIDNLFCDFFNPTTKTYCKRLRVICPEHSKDPKIGDEEVCGFPLVQDVFNETDKFCRVPKKKCAKHHGWEKIRRALIDMERVQQWLRIDELFEKEQRIRWQMSCRGGVLSLMLHQTIPAEEGPPVGSSPNSSSSFSDDSNN